MEQKECKECGGVMWRTWDANWKCTLCGYFEVDLSERPPQRPIFDRRESWHERKCQLDEWKDAMERWRKRMGK